MPDDALTVAARNAALKGEGLKSEVDRLLTDSRIDRFIEDFSRQWLQLQRVGMFAPDKQLYPAYDEWLETSLRREPVEFFKEMFAKNRSLEEFIHSDWTMANTRLCGFYGLPEPKTDGFQRVTLKPEDKRGGLLTMGAVLGLTSDGTRHRPVHRGVWLSEAIFNKTPPPPPANVDPIEPVPPEGDKVTVRQRLEVHATDANCASCHSRIDPLGFAWENYDAIGQWRTREHVVTRMGKDPVVDASGEMPGGGRFQDAGEFKQLILKDAATFHRAFIEHLCTYALRRTLSYDDQADIDQIVKQTQSPGLKDIVRAVATSELMRKR
jgi:mono/diheme cytochrome c family protein